MSDSFPLFILPFQFSPQIEHPHLCLCSILHINCSKMNPNQQQPLPITNLHNYHNHYFTPTMLSFPVTSDSASAIHPPGTDPLTNTVQDSTQTCLYGFVKPDFHNWIAKKPDSIGNEHAIGPSQDNSSAYGSISSQWNDTWSIQVLTNEVTTLMPDQTNVPKQILTNEVTMLVPDKTIVTKQIPCEVCKISCNSQNAYEKHIAGKKHKRILHLLANPTNNTLLAGPSNTNTTKLEKVCTTCNVVCNSEDMYDKHIAGKKHVKKVALMSNNGIGPHIAPKKIKADQSKWCDVCKIKCNSKDMYIAHLAGKQHLKKSEKLSKPNIDAGAGTSTANTSQPSANAIIGPQEKPGTEKPESQKAQKMDIEMKKLKIIQGGAAEADVRVCTLCDVVCNSQTMFQSHLDGNKHTSMWRKQTKATSG